MNFSFYKVDAAYCNFLRETDPCVPYTMEQKSARPFVGIVLNVNGFQYYAPLTSPKPKHLQMKNQIDFLKVNQGTWGAINFNNMIPVTEECVEKVDMKIMPDDSKAERDYKNLLSNQLSWCNSNRDVILNQANKLHTLIVTGKGWPNLRRRCCNFLVDEQRCAEFVRGQERSEDVNVRKPSVREVLAASKREAADRCLKKEGRRSHIGQDRGSPVK